MKYKRQLVSGMLAITLLTSGTTAFAAETQVRASKIPEHLNQVKMKSDGLDDELKTKELTDKKINKKTFKKIKDKVLQVNTK